MVLENFSGEIKASDSIGGGEWKKAQQNKILPVLQVNCLFKI